MSKASLKKGMTVWVFLLFMAGIYGCLESGKNKPPEAIINVSYNSSGEAPLTVSFTGAGVDEDGIIQSYFWDFKDGSTSNEQNPTHTFNNPGVYYVTLTVTDDDGSQGMKTVKITVTEKKVITVDFTYSPTNPTTNDIIQFTDKSTSTEGDITSWYWEFDATGGSLYTDETSTQRNPTYRYQFGYGLTIPVKLTVTDSKGNSGSVTKYITIAHQTHIPQGDDITLEVLSHERKNYDLDGSNSPLDGWIFVWLTVRVTNNWDNDIIPRWSFDDSPYWGDHFYIYTNYDPNDWWGYSDILPEDTPEKLASGESFTWTITFWIESDSVEYKVEFAYYYDIDLSGNYKEVTFSASL